MHIVTEDIMYDIMYARFGQISEVSREREREREIDFGYIYIYIAQYVNEGRGDGT